MITQLRDRTYGMVDVFVRAASRLVLSVLIARQVGGEVYATFVLLVGVEIVCTSLLYAGVTTPFMSVAPGLSQSRQAALEHHALRLHLRASALVLVVGSACAIWTDPRLTLAFASFLAASLIANCLRSFCQSHFKSRVALIGDCIGNSTSIAIVSTLDLSLGHTWIALAAGQTIAIACMLWQQAPRSGHLANSLHQRIADIRKPSLIGSVAYSACSRLQPFILGMTIGASAVAGYGAAILTAGMIRVCSNALTAVLRPRLALYHNRGDAQRACDITSLACRILLLGGGTLAITSISVAEYAQQLLFPAQEIVLSTLLPLALAYASVEGTGSVLTTHAQTILPHGAQMATQLRIRTAIASLILVWPVGNYLGPAGLLAVQLAIELIFVYSLWGTVLRAQAHTDDVEDQEPSTGRGHVPSQQNTPPATGAT